VSDDLTITPKRYAQAVGQPPGMHSATPYDPSSEPSPWNHGRTVALAAGQPPGKRRPPSDPSSKPLPQSCVRSSAQAALADTEPNPLDYWL